MTKAVSGKEFEWAKGRMRISCKGGTSVMEINQDDIGFNLVSGGVVVDGVIPDGAVIETTELGSDEPIKNKIRFTGTGTVSYMRIVD